MMVVGEGIAEETVGEDRGNQHPLVASSDVFVSGREECGDEDMEEESEAYSFEDSEADSILDARAISVESPSVRSCSVGRGGQRLVAGSPRTHLLERHLSEQDHRRSITHIQLRGATNGERYALPGVGPS